MMVKGTVKSRMSGSSSEIIQQEYLMGYSLKNGMDGWQACTFCVLVVLFWMNGYEGRIHLSSAGERGPYPE
jgi:hypothetical protein